MTEQESIGRAIRDARLARGLSLRSMAGSLHLSPATLSTLETGRSPITVERLQQIATLLNVSTDRLLHGETGIVPTGPEPPERDWHRFEAIRMTPVLEAASRVFVRQGFHAASMREIAAEARLSVAGVYHHHPSKENLLEAILEVTMSEIQWRIEAAREDGDGLGVSFALMVEALALFHAVRGDLAFLGASEMRGLTGEAHERVVAQRNRVQYTLDDQARHCLREGVFACHDPHTVGRAISTMCTALPSWFRPEGPITPQQIARQYAEMALTLMGSPDRWASQPRVTVSRSRSALSSSKDIPWARR